MSSKKSLLLFRNEINNVDKKIVELLGKRKNLVLQIAKSKIENNQEIRDIKREKKILDDLVILGKKNHLQPDYITQLFQLIIQESVSTQKKILKKFHINNQLNLATFSFLGPKGSYSYIAAYEYAKKNYQTCITNQYKTFEEVFLSVENNYSDYAIVPIENSCSGIINEVFDLLKKTNLFIVGEIDIFINHCLLALEKIELNKIQTIYSHPQPFQQCSNFIKKFPKWIIKHTKSTSDAMRKIVKYNNITNAALGSEIGSKIYNLNILSSNLANQKNNITRFILLQKKSVNNLQNKPIQTTIIFSVERESKKFEKILFILQKYKIKIKKLISQKHHKNLLEDTFYVDLIVNLESISIQNILKKIKKIANFIKILGSYPIEK